MSLFLLIDTPHENLPNDDKSLEYGAGGADKFKRRIKAKAIFVLLRALSFVFATSSRFHP